MFSLAVGGVKNVFFWSGKKIFWAAGVLPTYLLLAPVAARLPLALAALGRERVLVQEPVCICATDRMTPTRPRWSPGVHVFLIKNFCSSAVRDNGPNQPFIQCLAFSCVRFGPYFPSVSTCDCLRWRSHLCVCMCVVLRVQTYATQLAVCTQCVYMNLHVMSWSSQLIFLSLVAWISHLLSIWTFK